MRLAISKLGIRVPPNTLVMCDAEILDVREMALSVVSSRACVIAVIPVPRSAMVMILPVYHTESLAVNRISWPRPEREAMPRGKKKKRSRTNDDYRNPGCGQGIHHDGVGSQWIVGANSVQSDAHASKRDPGDSRIGPVSISDPGRLFPARGSPARALAGNFCWISDFSHEIRGSDSGTGTAGCHGGGFREGLHDFGRTGPGTGGTGSDGSSPPASRTNQIGTERHAAGAVEDRLSQQIQETIRGISNGGKTTRG